MGSNTNKLILLVVAAVALLLALNIYQKQIGKNLAIVLSVVTIVVVGYVAYQLVSEPVAANNVPMNNAPLNNLQAPVNVSDEELENVLNMELEEEVNSAGMNNAGMSGGNNTAAAVAAANNAAVAANNAAAANNVPVEDVLEGFQNNNEEEESNNRNNSNNSNNSNNANNRNNPVNNGTFTCSDLLPGDSNSTWAQVNPSGVGALCDKNLLNSGHHLGVNTVGTSMRNANRQLRADPPNPQVRVSPWLQTTISPDLLRRPLE